MIKLNLGCGDVIMPGWVNCDLYNDKADLKCDAKKIPYEANTVDTIYASHLLEHFDFHEANGVLKEWIRVLKPGGKLIIETPDFLASCKAFVDSGGGDTDLYGHFFATPWIEGQVHKFLYTEQQLGDTLVALGLKDVHREPALRYIGCENINLNMVGTK